MKHRADPPLTQRDRLTLAVVLCGAALAILATQGGCYQPAESLPGVGPGEPHVGRGDASEVYLKQNQVVQDIAEHWKDAGLKFDGVYWEPCKQENSYFYPGYRQVELCTEMSQYPEAAVFFAAHEMGHALAWQLAGTMDEASADQIGALEMARMGLREEMLGTAVYFAEATRQDHTRGENHPGNHQRARFLMCMEDGAEEHPSDPECGAMLQGLRAYWDYRLHQPQTGNDPDGRGHDD